MSVYECISVESKEAGMFRKSEKLHKILRIVLSACLFWLNLADASLATRQRFEESLDAIKKQVYAQRVPLIQQKYNAYIPEIFISYAWDAATNPWIDQVLSRDLERL